METTESRRSHDCPECRGIGSVVMGLCSVCLAEFTEGGPVLISRALSWDLDLDEPQFDGPRVPLGW